jgi:nucleotide-binding universal stress UspA family protein
MRVFGTSIHLLHILKGGKDTPEKAEAAMKEFAKSNGIEKFQTHLLKDSDIEAGVIHFNQMNNMDMVCIGTHGTGGIFHSSAAERLINHMYKPVISFRIK